MSLEENEVLWTEGPSYQPRIRLRLEDPTAASLSMGSPEYVDFLYSMAN